MRQLISLAGVLEAEQSALDGEHVFHLPSYHPTFGARRGQIGLRDDIPAHSDEILHAAGVFLAAQVPTLSGSGDRLCGRNACSWDR